MNQNECHHLFGMTLVEEREDKYHFSSTLKWHLDPAVIISLSETGEEFTFCPRCGIDLRPIRFNARTIMQVEEEL